jgi:hypothetical protein
MAKDRNRRNICKYFEDYDSSRTKRSSYLAFLRWLLKIRTDHTAGSAPVQGHYWVFKK